MPASPNNSDRLAELLADRAMHGLSVSEERELESIGTRKGFDDEAFGLAAAAIDLALFPPVSRMPAEVRNRLEASAERFAAQARAGGSRTDVIAKIEPVRSETARVQANGSASAVPQTLVYRSSLVSRLGWVVAAASLGLAAVVWMNRPRVFADPAHPTDLASERNQLLANAGTVVKCDWQDWAAEGQGPEIPGVKGDVVFDPKTQCGYMRFVGLPDNPRQCQYQLWIVDERGMGQRISGAIFDAHAGGKELIVPVSPRITVGRPVAFAVTIEQPGGTWVSDMKRRVVIATPKG